jgi:cyanophycin synthetase
MDAMQELDFATIRAMKGNGSSMRMILKYFLNKGAQVYLVHEEVDPVERYYLVKYDGLTIPLRAAKLNFYSIYNSLLAQTITTDKYKTASFLKAFAVPTPDTILAGSAENNEVFHARYGAIVVKPRDGSHGEGITTNVESPDQLARAIDVARNIHKDVLLQQQVVGEDHRLLFIDGKMAAAVKRIPAFVIGDGISTVRQLIEQRNNTIAQLWEDIRSGAVSDEEVRGSVSKTPIEEVISAFGEAFLDTVPGPNEHTAVVRKANVSLGGQTEDITDTVSPELISSLENLLKHISLPICGVDVMSTDISAPLGSNQSYVIELNAAPGLKLHELPAVGTLRNVCAQVAESLINYYRTLA